MLAKLKFKNIPCLIELSRPEGGSTTARNDIKRWDKAQKVVEDEGVKLNRFLPSGRSIWTVTGHGCDYLVDCIPTKGKPYCSCDDFHFRVLGGKVAECYHLVAAKRAIAEEIYTVVERKDAELGLFMKTLLSDIFTHIS